MMFVISELGRWRQADSSGLLVSQPCLRRNDIWGCPLTGTRASTPAHPLNPLQMYETGTGSSQQTLDY